MVWLHGRGPGRACAGGPGACVGRKAMDKLRGIQIALDGPHSRFLTPDSGCPSVEVQANLNPPHAPQNVCK